MLKMVIGNIGKTRGTTSKIAVRCFSVKQLPWCALSDAPVRKPPTLSPPSKEECKKFEPIEAFGIVAAVCRPWKGSNTTSPGIIGINGRLPWKSLPSDRKIFEDLTKDKILIVGRKTLLFEQEGNLDHVNHAKHCIVVSKSMQSIDDYSWKENDRPFLKLAASLEEALDVARVLEVSMRRESTREILCWIGGGQRLYEEALQHASARELHLSVVDMEIDLKDPSITEIARFPAKYRWDHKFEPYETLCHDETSPRFVYRKYKRILRQQPP